MTRVLKVCLGRVCSEYGSKYLIDRAQAETNRQNKSLIIEPCNCLGACEKAPNVVYKEKMHSHMTGPKLAQLLKS